MILIAMNTDTSEIALIDPMIRDLRRDVDQLTEQLEEAKKNMQRLIDLCTHCPWRQAQTQLVNPQTS